VSHFAIAVPFPGLAEVVDDWRERTCVTKPSHGIPPHVTLLTPSPADVATLVELLEPFEAFDVRFERLDRFPGTLWLAPEPAEPFVLLTETLVGHWPSHKPYGGTFKGITPHLTVAQRELDDAADALAPFLPLESRAESIVLYEQLQPDHWREVATVEL
jgi:2'-5' RNA ligase